MLFSKSRRLSLLRNSQEHVYGIPAGGGGQIQEVFLRAAPAAGLEVQAEIHNLLERKKVTEEKDLNPRIPVIHHFIGQELERQKALGDAMEDDRCGEWRGLNSLFREVLRVSDLWAKGL